MVISASDRGRATTAPLFMLVAVTLLAIVGCGDDRATPSAPRSANVSATSTTTSTTIAVATTAPTPTSTTAAPLRARVVVIDPGHNEHNFEHPDEINQQVDVITQHKACDTTGTATDSGYTEAAFTTDVANRVAGLLRDQGLTVILTRDSSTPWGPCITERAAIGNEAHADAAISIHADGGPADGHGFHVITPALVAGHNDAIIDPSARLGVQVRDAYRTATSLGFSTYAGRDGLDQRDDLGGLNLSTVPKVFIECANMRNASDASQLEDPSFRQRIADGIAAGLMTFLGG